MARVTVEDCVDKVPNRFDLVMLAAHRSREIAAGSAITIDRDNDKNPVVALREIADETQPVDELRERMIESIQTQIEVDEPEDDAMALLLGAGLLTSACEKQLEIEPEQSIDAATALTDAQAVESAVVGYPHDIKGQGIYAYVIYQGHHDDEGQARQNITQTVSRIIGPIAKPDKIQFVSGLPKTRSGKIMRRILRKIAEGEKQNFGDTTTLLDPAVVEQIAAGKI